MSAQIDARSGSDAVTGVVLGESTPTIGRLATAAVGAADAGTGGIAGATGGGGGDDCIGSLLRGSTAAFGGLDRGCVLDGSSTHSRIRKAASAARLSWGATDGRVFVTDAPSGLKLCTISGVAGSAAAFGVACCPAGSGGAGCGAGSGVAGCAVGGAVTICATGAP
jgi:hypothetical protein